MSAKALAEAMKLRLEYAMGAGGQCAKEMRLAWLEARLAENKLILAEAEIQEMSEHGPVDGVSGMGQCMGLAEVAQGLLR